MTSRNQLACGMTRLFRLQPAEHIYDLCADLFRQAAACCHVHANAVPEATSSSLTQRSGFGGHATMCKLLPASWRSTQLHPEPMLLPASGCIFGVSRCCAAAKHHLAWLGTFELDGPADVSDSAPISTEA